MRVYRSLAPADSLPVAASNGQRLGLLAIILTVFTVVVASHQLSPFATLAGITALMIFNRSGPRWLPVVMVLITVIWLQFMASTYLAGHGDKLTEQAGSVRTAVGANVTDRFGGSSGHLFVVAVRTGLTLALWTLALVGLWRRVRTGHRDLTAVLLGAAPFPLIVAQPYGGEMLLRVYLFSLPIVVFFVATAFFPAPWIDSSRRTTLLSGVATIVLLAGFLIIRFGNERMDHYTTNEVAATRYLYSVAPPGSVFIAGTSNTPWKDRDYERFHYRALSNELTWDGGTLADPVAATVAAMNNDDYPATYLIITESQIANDDLFAELPVPLRELKLELEESIRLRVIYANEDATIFVLDDRTVGKTS